MLLCKYDAKYDYVNDSLMLIKKEEGDIVRRIEGKYGIEIGLSVNDNPISILIPEPEILMGIDIDYIKQFCK